MYVHIEYMFIHAHYYIVYNHLIRILDAVYLHVCMLCIVYSTVLYIHVYSGFYVPFSFCAVVEDANESSAVLVNNDGNSAAA